MLIPVSFPFHPLLIRIWGWGSVGAPGASLWVTPKEGFWCGSTHLEMKAQLRGKTKCKPGWNGIINILLCLLLPPTIPLWLYSDIFSFTDAVQEWGMQTDYQLLLLISFTVQGEILVHSLQLLTFCGCVGNIQTQKWSGWGGTPKATAALAQNKSLVALRDTREACQVFQEVLAMNLVPKIDFGSELIENYLVARVLEVKVPHL